MMEYWNVDFIQKCFRHTAIVLMMTLFLLVSGVSAQTKAVTAKLNKEGIQIIELKAGDYYFFPRIITVKVNVPVEIRTIRKSEFVQHNIILKAPEAGIEISESITREPKVIKFTPTKTGKYLFYCDRKYFIFIKHRSKGMEGILKVVE